ncbi:MAG: aminotransferase class V-fold PLP-dependent enzyme [Prolixibacteraceae bacterium]|jgi:selenocysteine lyase/cysteine desulfurase|nr:aminotransferase class V-fold PLP-dependent enzyme [Prolixibacteraceae bacterium]
MHKSLEQYFSKFRDNIIGNDTRFETPYGTKPLIYFDWIASGRLYEPIEKKIIGELGPFVGNTHTETSETGTRMTHAYHWSHRYIKQHVNAGSNDVIITAGFGMTAVINKFQRILGLKYCGKLSRKKCLEERLKPVVFLTHMEHHSNQTSWYETNADVVVLKPGNNLLVDPEILREELKKYKDRKLKIGSFTACSNVTGIKTPIYKLARIMHEYGGVIFADFAASAPYDEINMHPANPKEKLDAVMFSPHKFLGGPGTPGVLVFDASMYHSSAPDNPGGGTVDWTNPWGKYKYVDSIELREDGGTPGFLQSIKAALCFKLKDEMGLENILKREKELLKRAFEGIDKIPEIKALANETRDRLGIISFYAEGIHYNLFVKLLNDLYGIQTRGGCACAGTYGHFLLSVDENRSDEITEKITHGDLSVKPGWVRWSLHPTTTDAEVDLMLKAMRNIVANHKKYANDYIYDKHKNNYKHINELFDLEDFEKKLLEF